MLLLFPYPYYVKKEDARSVYLMQRKVMGLIVLGLALVSGIMLLVVNPKLMFLYKDLNIPVPLSTQLGQSLSIIMTILGLCLSLYFFFAKPNFSALDEKLSKCKEGEMIKTTNIVNIQLIVVMFILIAVYMALLIYANVLPIYSLSNQFTP